MDDPRQSPQRPPPQMDVLSHPVNDEPSPLWDWNEFLDFSLGDDQLTFPVDPNLSSPSLPEPEHVALPPLNPSDRVRKRDPRMSCANFMAGRIPCACPEMDEKLEAEEGGPGKKRPRTFRALVRCQVPDCRADISLLKGYHRRHRVCLRCANAASVMLDGQNKRYCQQCGKFHIMSDFDEGKRSCRRKLERHNNRRRRKSFGSKVAQEKELQQVLLAEDVRCDDETGKDNICTNGQVAEAESLFESDGFVPSHDSVLAPQTVCSALGSQTVGSAHNSQTPCTTYGSQNLQSDSVVTFTASDDTQIGLDKDDNKCTLSPSYCENKSAFSSVCPTGRISFKLYDWNPAEFPRRLRHQIFQWLASMPVELEGYIRPGCTILTVFIAMPMFMWIKLHGDPFVFIRDFAVAPGSILSRKGTLFIHLNNMIYHVTEDGTSVAKVRVEDRAPKLHYIHPTCFEAGKPIEFVVCGSNLLQPKFRFLLSFAGRYLENEFCKPSSCGYIGDDNASSFSHQLLKIRASLTDQNLVGPAFVEVENQSGLSNFVPILITNKDICTEMKMIQQKLDVLFCPKSSVCASNSSPCDTLSSRRKQFCELIIDIGWLLKEPLLDNLQDVLTSSQVQRFNSLLRFLIQNKAISILDRVLDHIKLVMIKRQAVGIADADMQLLQRNLKCAGDLIGEKCVSGNLLLDSVDSLPEYLGYQGSKDETLSVVQVTDQDTDAVHRGKLDSVFVESGTTPLLTGDVVMSVNLKNLPKRSCNSLLTSNVLSSRSLAVLCVAVVACFGLCAVFLHPQKVGRFATSIRRYVFDNS